MNTTIAHTNYFGRIGVYLAEMFPVVPRLILSVLIAVATVLIVARAAPEPAAPGVLSFAIATFNVFALLLILRLMDELKDLEIDAELFAFRPVPSGRTLPSDIGWSLAIATAVFIAVNTLVAGVFVFSLIALAYTYLMFKYFFSPGLIANNLLLNLATHNPVSLLIVFGLVEVAAETIGLSLNQIDRGTLIAFVALVWSLFFAWEIGRKIRSAEEETAYVTYSRVLGRRTATLVVLAAVFLSASLAVHLVIAVGLHWAALTVVAVAASVATLRLVRFLVWPGPRTSALKAAIESYLVTILAALIFGAVLIEFGGSL